MGIPSVNLLSNQAGGGINAAMAANNALANANILRQINQVKNQYMPLTTQAEAASKLAYANLMGPQFLAKLLGNNAAVANMGDAAAKAALQKSVTAGMGQGGGNSLNSLPGSQQGGGFTGIGQPSTNAISGGLINSFMNMLGIGSNKATGNNALTSQQNQPQPMANQALAPEPEQTDEAPQESFNQGFTPVSDNDWDTFSEWQKSPEGIKKRAEMGDNYIPPKKELDAWSIDQHNKTNPMELTVTKKVPRQKSYGEKAADYESLQSEGKETGKIRTKQRDELDQQYQQALEAEVPMQHLNEIVKNPLFQKLRRDGALQKLQLDVKEITGTPEEKELLGDFQTTAKKALASSIMGWKGRILDKEVGISNSMKISGNDSFYAILGKMPTIEAFDKMTMQRARIASKLMRDQHISKGDAIEQADKQVNGKAIREKVAKELHPTAVNKSSKPDFSKMTEQQIHDWAEANGGRL